MDKLAQMTVFAAVVEAGSFTGAADNLGIAKSTVSRRVSELEDRLGVRLLTRTTRVTRPTDVGQAYYERCARIIEDAAEADRAVIDEQSAPRGLLRITAAPPFANRYLIEPLATLLDRHPDLRAELILEERLVNIVEEGIDVAIRIAHPRSSGLVAKRFGTSEMVICASPSYLEKHGTPQVPEDLSNHVCLERTGDSWMVRGEDGEDRPIEVKTRFSADQGDSLLQGAIAGIGVAVAPDFMVRDELERGLLQPILREYWPQPRPVYALFLHRRLLSPRVRVFIDHLAKVFETPPWQL